MFLALVVITVCTSPAKVDRRVGGYLPDGPGHAKYKFGLPNSSSPHSPLSEVVPSLLPTAGDDAISQPPPPKRQCLHIGGHKCNTPDMGILGRNIEMEFEDDSGNATTWWTGIVTQYDSTKDQYAAFFPSDNATVWFQAEEEDYRVIP